MKILYFSIIILVLLSSIDPVPAHAVPVNPLFMKVNSIAKIIVEYTFSSSGNWTLDPLVYSVPNLKGPVSSVTVETNPDFIKIDSNHLKYNVTYTLTAKNNVSGPFELYIGFCGRYLPFVVGLNESEVDSKIFQGFANGDNFGCSPYEPTISTEDIVGYSYVTTQQTSTIPEFPFAIPILILSIVSLIMMHRIRIRN